MILRPAVSVIDPDHVESGIDLDLHLKPSNAEGRIDLERVYAYTPLINAHDHLVGNWVPRAGDNRPYANAQIWMEDMKNSFSLQERHAYWTNEGLGNIHNQHDLTLVKLGCYKNLFSGCGVVADHVPVQGVSYYSGLPVKVISNYRQCHSLSCGNYWGGESAEKEMELTQGKIPFIIHIGEGTDAIAEKEFAQLTKLGLLQANTLLIHGVALTAKDFEQIAKTGASVCWSPTSNLFMLGKTMDVQTALQKGVNVTLGSDSTLSGGMNLISEFLKVRELFPDFATKELFRMSTVNAARALMLPHSYAKLDPKKTANLILVDALDPDPFANLLEMEAANIRLLVVEGVPRFGDSEWLEDLGLPEENYTIFRTGNREKFVWGDPQALNDDIDSVLGYHKDFPYLPF